MSFWNSLKPVEKTVVATHVELSDDRRRVSLTWSDGAHTEITARALRQACPCAGCVEEWTGKRTLDVEQVPVDTTITSILPVGNYALSFVFHDGHGTGLYEWKSLKALTETAARP